MKIIQIPTREIKRTRAQTRALAALRELISKPDCTLPVAGALAMLGDESAINGLFHDDRYDKHDVARIYVKAISRRGGHALFALFRHPSEDVRWCAINQISTSYNKVLAVDALANYFKAFRLGNVRHRLYCAIGLANLGDLRGLRYIRAWMVTRGMVDHYDGANAMNILVQDNSPATCRTLVKILRDENGQSLFPTTFYIDDVDRCSYNLEAAVALRRFGVTQEACSVLSLVVRHELSGLSSCIQAGPEASGRPPHRWNDAVELLGFLEDPLAIPVLLEALPKSQGRVERALARIGAPEFDGLLLRLIRSLDKRTRLAAMLSLGRRGDSRVLPVLIETLRIEKEPESKIALIDALRGYAWEDVRDELRSMSRESTSTGARNAINALATLGDGSECSIYLASLHHPSALVRLAAVHAIAGFGDDEVTEALVQVIAQRHDVTVDREFRGSVRSAALDELANRRLPTGVHILIESLNDDDAEVRAASARACLAHAQHTDSLRLWPLLMDESNDVTGPIASTLRKLGDYSATDELIRLANDERGGDVSHRAIEALGLLNAV